MAEDQMLQVILFALLFGLALSKAGASGEKLRAFFADLNDVIVRLISMIVSLTPIGVFLFDDSAWGDPRISRNRKSHHVLCHRRHCPAGACFRGLPATVENVPDSQSLMFLRKMRSSNSLAFSTSSSGATLPVTLRTVEHKLGVQNNVSSFAVPLGATINMDGTAIMQGVATVFIAQFYGIDLTLGALLTVVLTATLASIGTAAVPGVGLIMLTMVLIRWVYPLRVSP